MFQIKNEGTYRGPQNQSTSAKNNNIVVMRLSPTARQVPLVDLCWCALWNSQIKTQEANVHVKSSKSQPSNELPESHKRSNSYRFLCFLVCEVVQKDLWAPTLTRHRNFFVVLQTSCCYAKEAVHFEQKKQLKNEKFTDGVFEVALQVLHHDKHS